MLRRFLLRTIGVAAVLATGFGLLAGGSAVSAGVRQALEICGSLLIPSLFPYMVLASLLPSTAAGRLVARPVSLPAGAFYRLPGRLAPALLMSWLGGYPAGAYTLRGLVERGELTPQEAGLALCCCVNSGPAFMVTVVGGGVFGSPLLGLKLFGCQLVAGMVVGLLLGVRVKGNAKSALPADKPLGEALVAAVNSASAAMVSICAFVLVAGAASSLLEYYGFLNRSAGLLSRLSFGWFTPAAAQTLLTGSLEICSGCSLAVRLTPIEALKVLPFLLSFGGVSVICQVMAALGGLGVPMGRFLLSRPLHGIFTALLAFPLLYRECSAMTAMLPSAPVLFCDRRTAIGVVLMLCLCAFLCLTVEEGSRKVV